MDVKTIRIYDIGLSRRSANALYRSGVRTVGEMLVYTEETLSEIRNMGRKSIDEVLLKIDEYRKYDLEGGLPAPTNDEPEILPELPVDFGAWCVSDEGRLFVLKWLGEKQIKVSALELLSARAYNHLLLNKMEDLQKIIFLSVDELMNIPRMDLLSAEEIVKKCRVWLKYNEPEILAELKRKKEIDVSNQRTSLRDLLYSKDEHARILEYVQANDYDLEVLAFSVRAKNLLLRNGYHKLSDFIFVTRNDMENFKGMGAGTLKEIQSFIDDYLEKHATRLKAFCSGDNTVIWDEDIVRTVIIDTYNKIGFDGLSLRELREKAVIPEQVPDALVKSVLGNLIAEGGLEYVDFRCYRIYPKFNEYLIKCTKITDRTREIIKRRLKGETLESIASDYDMTRERVRQIVSKNSKTIISYLHANTGMERFDEDYYRYFFETYSIDKKDAEEWLGIAPEVFNYLEMTGAVRGKKELDDALDDYHNLDHGFRLKIKNYLNRNKLFLDGRWVDKTRVSLEEYVARKFCRETVSYEQFICIYNNFLREEEVPYDEDIYYTDSVKRTRENKLKEDRFILWKMKQQLRYYDINGQDFTELLDTLNLGAYENVEYSTCKFMRDYPEIMEKYDIRDEYELHNLLRKIVKDGAYHDFHCERTPMIRFGSFDMAGAIMEIMIDNAPISQSELAELISQEYGYDPSTVIGGYLKHLSAYYHKGIYSINQKTMSVVSRTALLKELSEDFYYIDEIRKIYARIVPDADLEEINPYNLKWMGFSVLTRYVYRNHSSLDAYFRDLLTREDITDITPYRSRFAYIVSFSATIVNMKKELEILEFEPNQIITFRKLAAAGVMKEDLQAFCDETADFVEDGTYFSVQSLKKAGFESELFNLGFSDWFYASLLTSDDQFSYTKVFGNIILFKGKKLITIQSFEESLIRAHGSIDVYDLMSEMEENYGCRIPDRFDLIYKVISGTDIYYDKYMDRLYANTGIFSRELDAEEGL